MGPHLYFVSTRPHAEPPMLANSLGENASSQNDAGFAPRKKMDHKGWADQTESRFP